MLVSAGNVKRDRIMRVKEGIQQRGEQVQESSIAENLPEQEVTHPITPTGSRVKTQCRHCAVSLSKTI